MASLYFWQSSDFLLFSAAVFYRRCSQVGFDGQSGFPAIYKKSIFFPQRENLIWDLLFCVTVKYHPWLLFGYLLYIRDATTVDTCKWPLGRKHFDLYVI